MKNIVQTLLVAAFLVSFLTVSAQQKSIYLYSRTYLPNQDAFVEFNAPPGNLVLSLERVLEPEQVLLGQKNIRKPVLPTNAKTKVIRRVTRRLTSDGYDRFSFGKLPVGVYAVRATKGQTKTSILMIVSDLGLVVKRAPTKALTYSVNRFSGTPKIASVWLWDGGIKDQTLSNKDGIAQLEVGKKSDPIFLARAGNSWALSGGSWNSYEETKIKGYIYTDRPVYRPGHHVEFKGTLRDAKSLKAISSKEITVTVRASQDDSEVFKKDLKTGDFGSFNSGFDLTLEAVTGTYYISANLKGDTNESYQGSFIVEAYQKPEYSVTVKPSRDRAVQGDRVKFKINADYLFGGKVSGAKVTYFVTKANYYAYTYDGETYDGSGETADYGSDLVIREEARLDKNGSLEVSLPLEKNPNAQALSYRIQAEVEDESRRTVAGNARVIAFPSAVNVSSRTSDYIYQPGDTITSTVNTSDLNDKPISSVVSLELVRESWIKVKNDYKSVSTTLFTRSIKTGADGVGIVNFKAPQGGGYNIIARARDGAGRVSKSESFVWVLSDNQDWYWNYRELEIKLDQKNYKVGDTATALIGSPKPGAPVLVTLEQDGIRRYEVVRSQSAAIRYRFKITKDMQPNVYISAVMASDGSFYSSSASVRVPVTDAFLKVAITPDKAKYLPGEKGKLEIAVTDVNGKGVPAELGVGVIDEAIYLVRADDTPDIRGFYYGTRGNLVGYNTSEGFSFEVEKSILAAQKPETGRARFAQNKEDSAAKQAAPGDSPNTPRKDFRDTALWVPNLVTDENGRATLEVSYPDNLTTYRTTARGITQDAKVGQGTGKSLVTKDVLTRLITPSFLVRGDSSVLSSITNNTTENSITAQQKLELQNLETTGSTDRQYPLTAKARERTDYTVTASKSGTATAVSSVSSQGGSDAMQLSIPVLPRGFEQYQGWAANVSEGAKTLSVPNDANLESAKLRVYITPNLTGAVAPALEYLVGYPYGCTEQTMSRFLPALLAQKTIGLNGLTQATIDQIPAITKAGIKRLLDFQHSDGGWGFWQTDTSTLEMSAYVLHGLVKAKQAGAKVPNAALENAIKYISKTVQDGKLEQGERAYAYRSLAEAGRVNVDALQRFSRRTELDPYALANAAIGLAKIGKTTDAKDVLDRLKAKRIERDRGIHWEKPKKLYDWYYYWDDNDIQTTAVALEAIAKLEPSSPLLPKVSNWVLKNRSGARWVSTQDTASVIEAALALPKAPAATNSTSSIALNGASITPKELPSSAGTQSLELPIDSLKAGQNTLEVQNTDPNTLYSAELKYSREPTELKSSDSSGLRVNRKYEKLEAKWDAKQNRYVYGRKPLLSAGKLQPITVGDMVLVTLYVKSLEGRMQYVLVSDPIPAGMKALDERSLSITGVSSGDNYYDWNYWYSGRDIRDERVDLYAYSLVGTQTMQYILRAQTPGKYTALPANASLMYDPEVTGQSAASTFTIRDRGQ
jgi:alpha-2-macroglobulin